MSDMTFQMHQLIGISGRIAAEVWLNSSDTLWSIRIIDWVLSVDHSVDLSVGHISITDNLEQCKTKAEELVVSVKGFRIITDREKNLL